MENYTEQFKSLKGSRTLQWKPHLGLVELELELEDRTLSFTVTPARAATIMNFQQKRKLSDFYNHDNFCEIIGNFRFATATRF